MERKDIEGYEGLYMVNNIGQIKFLERRFDCGRLKKERIIKSTIDGGRYSIVGLYKDGKNKKKLLHRIVAQAFIPNTENKETVNHKNGIKTDNRLENLEWMTHSENLKHSFRKLGRKHSGGKDRWRHHTKNKSLNETKF